MDIERIVLIILAIVGIIVLFMVTYYFIMRYIENRKRKSTQPTYPPASWMEASGGQCPDYWVNEGSVGSGRHKCVNKFKIPVVPSESSLCENVKCYDDGNEKDMGTYRTFKTITNWPVKNRKDIRDRCRWRDCCQARPNIPSSWIGISDTCQY